MSEIDDISIRPFTAADAEECFRIRTKAFIIDFYPYLEPEAVASGINAYLPSNYMRMDEAMHAFVAADIGTIAGFYFLKILDRSTAELALLYVRDGYKGKGIGSLLLQHMEGLLRDRYPEIVHIVLDTIVPRYNGKFYEKMGFVPEHESTLCYPDLKVAAIRMSKEL